MKDAILNSCPVCGDEYEDPLIKIRIKGKGVTQYARIPESELDERIINASDIGISIVREN